MIGPPSPDSWGHLLGRQDQAPLIGGGICYGPRTGTIGYGSWEVFWFFLPLTGGTGDP